MIYVRLMAKFGHADIYSIISTGGWTILSHPKQMRYQAAPRADMLTKYIISQKKDTKILRQLSSTNSAHECSKMHRNEGGYSGKIWTIFRFLDYSVGRAVGANIPASIKRMKIPAG